MIKKINSVGTHTAQDIQFFNLTSIIFDFIRRKLRPERLRAFYWFERKCVTPSKNSRYLLFCIIPVKLSPRITLHQKPFYAWLILFCIIDTPHIFIPTERIYCISYFYPHCF